MSKPTSWFLASLAAVALAAVGCDRQSSSEQPEAQAPESARERAPGQAVDEKSGADGAEKADERSGPPTSLEELPEGTNPVQYEMQLLNTAMQNTLTLIANDALAGIPAQIKKVHPARQLTARALEQGTYRPPARSDDIEAFERQDKQFHRELKGLLKAAKQDDLEKATEQYGKLVEGCTDCHTKFRFE